MAVYDGCELNKIRRKKKMKISDDFVSFSFVWFSFDTIIQYQVLMTQAILSFYPFNVLTQPYTRKTRKVIHIVLESIGGVAAISGMIIEFIGRSQSSKNHFTTIHSTIGLISGILTLIGMLNGLSALYAMELRLHVKPVYVKFLHNLNGITAFTLGKLNDLAVNDQFSMSLLFDVYFFADRNDCALLWIR